MRRPVGRRLGALVGALACGAVATAVEAAVVVEPMSPSEMKVQVQAGSVTFPDQTVVSFDAIELTFSPPEVRTETVAHTGGPDDPQIPGNYDPAWDDYSWSNTLALNPDTGDASLFLGSVFRGVVQGTLVVENGDGSVTYVENADYKVNYTRGQVANVDGRLGPQGTTDISYSFQYVTQRLDLIQVSKAGVVTNMEGVPVVVCPTLPEPDADCVALAGVYIYTANHPGEYVIIAKDIFVIDPAAPVAPLNAEALLNTISKLDGSGQVTIAWFGDSIAAGAEAGAWWLDRTKTLSGLVMSDLGDMFPSAELYEVDCYQGLIGSDPASGGAVFDQKLMALVNSYSSDFVWWEAEDAYPARTDFPDPTTPWYKPNSPEEEYLFSGRQWLSKDTSTSASYAQYNIDVPAAGTYHFWVRKMDNGDDTPGAFNWQFDGGAMSDSMDADAPIDLVYKGSYVVQVRWLRLGTVEFTAAGAHTFRLELQDQSGDAGYDCFCLAPDTFRPNNNVKLDQRIDLLVIALGMNDSTRPTATLKANLKTYIDSAKAAGMEVLLVTPMEPNPWVEDYRALYEPGYVPMIDRAAAIVELAGSEGVACADVYGEWMNWPTRGVPQYSQIHNWSNHPGLQGHRLYADVILRCLEVQPEFSIDVAGLADVLVDLAAGSTVTLDGGASVGAATFLWEQIDLASAPEAVTLTGADTATASFTANAVGIYTFQLTIGDGQGGELTTTVTVTVWSVLADAGADQLVETGVTVALDGTLSTGNVAGYSWTQTGGTGTAELSSATDAQPTFAAGAAGETYVFTLTVDDGAGNSDSDTVTITTRAESGGTSGGGGCAPVPSASAGAAGAFACVLTILATMLMVRRGV